MFSVAKYITQQEKDRDFIITNFRQIINNREMIINQIVIGAILVQSHDSNLKSRNDSSIVKRYILNFLGEKMMDFALDDRKKTLLD